MRLWRLRRGSSVLVALMLAWVLCVGAYYMYMAAAKPAASPLGKGEVAAPAKQNDFGGIAGADAADDHNAILRGNPALAEKAAAAEVRDDSKREVMVEEPDENAQSEQVQADAQDYSRIRLDEQRKQQGYDNYGFNEALSESIPIKRAVPDFRHNL